MNRNLVAFITVHQNKEKFQEEFVKMQEVINIFEQVTSFTVDIIVKLMAEFLIKYEGNIKTRNLSEKTRENGIIHYFLGFLSSAI